MKKLGIILLCIVLALAIIICTYLTWERRSYGLWDIPTDFTEYSDDSAALPTLSQNIGNIVSQPDMTDDEKKEAVSQTLLENGISCTDKAGNDVTQDVIDNVEQIYNEGGSSAVINYFKDNEIEINGLDIMGNLIG